MKQKEAATTFLTALPFGGESVEAWTTKSPWELHNGLGQPDFIVFEPRLNCGWDLGRCSSHLVHIHCSLSVCQSSGHSHEDVACRIRPMDTLQFLAHVPSHTTNVHKSLVDDALEKACIQSVASPEQYTSVMRCATQLVDLLTARIPNMNVHICGSLISGNVASSINSIDLYLQFHDSFLRSSNLYDFNHQLLYVGSHLSQQNATVFPELSNIKLGNEKASWPERHLALQFQGCQFRLWTDPSVLRRTDLLKTYLSLDSMCTRLVFLMQRLFQKRPLSHVTGDPSHSSVVLHLPDEACVVLVIFYLQNSSPSPRLPNLHHLFALYESKGLPPSSCRQFPPQGPLVQQAYIHDQSVIHKLFPSPDSVELESSSSLRDLWLDLLRFYVFRVPLKEVRVSVTSWKPQVLNREEVITYTTVVIEDPMNPLRNLCTSAMPSECWPYCVFHFQQLCAKALAYLSVPQVRSSPSSQDMVSVRHGVPLFTKLALHFTPSHKVAESLKHLLTQSVKLNRSIIMNADYAMPLKLIRANVEEEIIKWLKEAEMNGNATNLSTSLVAALQCWLQSLYGVVLRLLWNLASFHVFEASNSTLRFVTETFASRLKSAVESYDTRQILIRLGQAFLDFSMSVSKSLFDMLWRQQLVVPLATLLALLEHSVRNETALLLPSVKAPPITPEDLSILPEMQPLDHWKDIMQHIYEGDGLRIEAKEEEGFFRPDLLISLADNPDALVVDFVAWLNAPVVMRLADVATVEVHCRREDLPLVALPWCHGSEVPLVELVAKILAVQTPLYHFDPTGPNSCWSLIHMHTSSTSSPVEGSGECKKESSGMSATLGGYAEESFYVEPVLLEINGQKVLLPVVCHRDNEKMVDLGEKLLSKARVEPWENFTQRCNQFAAQRQLQAPYLPAVNVSMPSPLFQHHPAVQSVVPLTAAHPTLHLNMNPALALAMQLGATHIRPFSS